MAQLWRAVKRGVSYQCPLPSTLLVSDACQLSGTPSALLARCALGPFVYSDFPRCPQFWGPQANKQYNEHPRMHHHAGQLLELAAYCMAGVDDGQVSAANVCSHARALQAVELHGRGEQAWSGVPYPCAGLLPYCHPVDEGSGSSAPHCSCLLQLSAQRRSGSAAAAAAPPFLALTPVLPTPSPRLVPAGGAGDVWVRGRHAVPCGPGEHVRARPAGH